MSCNGVCCTVIGVDCDNIPGFDFCVPISKLEHMVSYISDTLVSYEISVSKIYIYGGKFYLPDRGVWTEERIKEEIKNETIFLYNNKLKKRLMKTRI